MTAASGSGWVLLAFDFEVGLMEMMGSDRQWGYRCGFFVVRVGFWKREGFGWEVIRELGFSEMGYWVCGWHAGGFWWRSSGLGMDSDDSVKGSGLGEVEDGSRFGRVPRGVENGIWFRGRGSVVLVGDGGLARGSMKGWLMVRPLYQLMQIFESKHIY